jgi:Flp pilus assembly protein TadG
MNKRQRGLATVEFSIIGLLMMIVLFAVFEFGRLVWMWNTLSEAARRGARAAVVCPVNDPAPANIAVFNAPDDNSANPVLTGLSPANVSVDYLDDTGTPTAVFADIRDVRVRITGYTFNLLVPILGTTLSAPDFVTTLPRESLGIIPEIATPQCFASASP